MHFDGTIEKQEFELIADGDYEVTLSTEWKKTQAGDAYIGCTFKIRQDVDQKFGGRLIFDGIYKSQKTGDFQASKINGILSTVADAKQDFEDYDEVIQYFNGLNMIVTVETDKADPEKPNSKDRNVIKYLSYKPSVAGAPIADGATLVKDEQLPF